MNDIKKRRKGNIPLILAFSLIMSVVGAGLLAMATVSYKSTDYNNKQYAKMQTYDAATEVASYEFIAQIKSLQMVKTYPLSESKKKADLTDALNCLDEMIESLYSGDSKIFESSEEEEEGAYLWCISDLIPLMQNSILGVKPNDSGVLGTNFIVKRLTSDSTSKAALIDRPEFKLVTKDRITYNTVNTSTGLITSHDDAIGNSAQYLYRINPIYVDSKIRVGGEISESRLVVSGLYFRVLILGGTVSITVVEDQVNGVKFTYE